MSDVREDPVCPTSAKDEVPPSAPSGRGQEKRCNVRALHDAIFVAGGAPSAYCQGRIKVLFPAPDDVGLDLKVDDRGSPFPVVIFFVGSSVEANRYQWLGERLVAELRAVVVLFDAMYKASFGAMLGPIVGNSADGVKPTLKLSWLMEKLQEMNETGLLAGHLDLSRVVAGGHSHGSIAVFDSLEQEPLSNVKGVFLYGNNPNLLFNRDSETRSVNRSQKLCPIFHINGTRDSFVFGPKDIVGREQLPPREALLMLSEKGLLPAAPLTHVEIEGLNHYSILDPEDDSARGTHVDTQSTVVKSTAKDYLFTLYSLFIKTVITNDAGAVTEWNEAIQVGKLNIRDVFVKD